MTELMFTETWLREENIQVTKGHVLNEPDLCKYLFCLSFSTLWQFIYETDLKCSHDIYWTGIISHNITP